MSLQQEIETYDAHLDRLLAGDEGKYVVIHGDAVLRVFAAYEDALRAGYERVGVEPFLVKKIEAVETIHTLTRDVGICRT